MYPIAVCKRAEVSEVETFSDARSRATEDAEAVHPSIAVELDQ